MPTAIIPLTVATEPKLWTQLLLAWAPVEARLPKSMPVMFGVVAGAGFRLRSMFLRARPLRWCL